jgi:hypothetical protein
MEKLCWRLLISLIGWTAAGVALANPAFDYDANSPMIFRKKAFSGGAENQGILRGRLNPPAKQRTGRCRQPKRGSETPTCVSAFAGRYWPASEVAD